MGVDTFYDQEKGLAGLYCNTSERPLALVLFGGDEPVQQAEAFREQAELHFHVDDIRCVPDLALSDYQELWLVQRAARGE